ncbi:translation elongation factor Ts [Defluviicoccus vanus]|uniref:Elongation factor Ts n=1 Tax=Defluviicoccus vanus TaxID=111831 RepID=A0A7H1N4P2_9PROT|nr:translation elongation factor Ts [Defluviicoccus vanus]QNT70678.1 elongation factor Ts [Defluviicoccus vanus]
MTEISAGQVKALREKTGAGMMDCKRALGETAGDMEAAVDWLRKKGLSAAAKKAGRVAADGLIGMAVDGMRAAVVEVNAETDFVARNDAFKAFVTTVAGLALDVEGNIDALAALPYPGTDRSVAEQLTHLIATIGENMALRRAAFVRVDQGLVATYMHSASAEGLGRIGVLIGIETTADPTVVADLGRKLAMHVAAAVPTAVSRAEVDPKSVERERDILIEQARISGKPEAIIEKMVEGRLGKFYEEVCLLEQVYVVDGESKVKKVIDAAAKEAGVPITVSRFVRFALGEGIQKKQEDFAAAVAGVGGA